MEQIPLGGIVTHGLNTSSLADADPMLQTDGIHWLFSKEVYNPTRRVMLDGWSMVGQTENSVMYQFPAGGSSPGKAIVAYRGTQTLDDIKSDIQLSIPGGNCNFDAWKPEMQMIQDFITANEDMTVELTGHSLGGAIARCVGSKLGLRVVTFNAAAPPSNPVVSNANEVDYHIVFDLISAWQTPNTVRLDKGIRPAPYSRLPLRFLRNNLPQLLEAHSIDLFSNKKPTLNLFTPNQESLLIQVWVNSLPWLYRKAFSTFIGTSNLPPVE